MKFLVITNAPTLKKENSYKAYAPYVFEMDIWSKYVDEFKIISPTQYSQTLLLASFKKQPEVVSIPSLNFSNSSSLFLSTLSIPIIMYRLIKGMYWADHIHLRCPGNIGLLGCIVQVFFRKTIKTAKYAGNWDPNAKQPLSYRLQKWILSNTFLTKNMQVLVYGNWLNQTKNIKPFFTATYRNSEIEKVAIRDYNTRLKFVFIGSLVSGKRPLLAIQIIEKLYNQGFNVQLDVFGDGYLNTELAQYVSNNNLKNNIKLHGNQTKSVVKAALKTAHFSILPSKSEGWPKALAEAMFFGVIPIATAISCVPNMLDNENRGILIEPNINDAVIKIEEALSNLASLKEMAIQASKWSQYYTLDLFNSEIQKLIVV
jgi:glycosyltransferase involved in cell wall biosynthesis